METKTEQMKTENLKYLLQNGQQIMTPRQIADAFKEAQDLINKYENAVLLLKESRCPEPKCDNRGTIAKKNSMGEWEPQQCQWCYYRELATK